MTLKVVESDERYVPVNKLTGIDVNFISLVPKGANRIPFQIVKHDDESTELNTGDIPMNASMRPDQKIQATLFKMAGDIYEMKDVLASVKTGAKSITNTPGKPVSKLQRINAQVRADSDAILERIQKDMAGLSGQVEKAVAIPPERKAAPEVVTVEKRAGSSFDGAFGCLPPATQKAESKPEADTVPKDIFKGAFPSDSSPSVRKSDESEVFETNSNREYLEKAMACKPGVWDGQFGSGQVGVVVQKDDEPVEDSSDCWGAGLASMVKASKEGGDAAVYRQLGYISRA